MAGKKTDAEKAEMYRRQLGGTNAALRRERQRSSDLEKTVSYIWTSLSYGERQVFWETAPKKISTTVKDVLDSRPRRGE